jgi:acetylornithine deacetylase/succinyl-diaminopimelate desuccinylase-like protein
VSVSATERAVFDKIDETALVGLTTAVQAAGENPPGNEAATVAVLGAAAAELGLDACETQVQPGRSNLRITLAGGPGPGLLLLGHTDVVPIGEGWTRDPFGGVVEDGRIYGRGTSDMKGGLAAALAAIAALRSTGLSGPVELAALVDEEEAGFGIRAYVESMTTGTSRVRRAKGVNISGLHHRRAHRAADRRRRPWRLLPAG